MKVLIVDGHSVIFSWPELRKLHQKRMLLAREALVARIDEYCSFKGLHGVVVFDGKGAKTVQEQKVGEVQIFYAANGVAADQVIERLVAKYAAEHELVVVTSDHLEQQTVSSFGGSYLSAQSFKEQFDQAHLELEREIKRTNNQPWPRHRKE